MDSKMEKPNLEPLYEPVPQELRWATTFENVVKPHKNVVKPPFEIFTGKTASQSITMHKDVVLVINFMQFLSVNSRFTV